MKKLFLFCAAWATFSAAHAQLNVDITTGYDNSTSSLITPGQPDDTWQWWDGANYVYPLITTGYDSWNILHFPAPSNGCGEWTSPYVQPSGTTYNGNPANSAQVHEYLMTFNYTAGCPLTNARIELNAVGADDFIYFKLNNTVYNINSTLSNCGGTPPGTIAVQYNLTVPLNAADIVPGTNSLRVYVCSDYKWTGFVLCGALKADYLPDPNLVPTITGPSTFCSGSPVVLNGSSATSNVTNHYWEMAESDAAGNVVSGGYLWSGWYSGAPAGSFSIPNSATAPCGKYYKIKLALQNACSVWAETNKVIFIACNPAPVITGPSQLCYGQSGTYSIGYTPRSTIVWSTGQTGVTSINYTPTASTTISVTVTNNNTGCSGTATFPITVFNTNPDFTLTSTLYTGYFTCTAAPVVTTGLPAGFSYAWIAEEVGPPPTYTTVPNTTVSSPSCWWTMSTSFPGYNGTSTLGACSGMGQFTQGHYYRITRGTWSTDCGWQQISKIVFMCSSCRNGSGPIVVENDPNAPSYEKYFSNPATSETANDFSILPNPNNGSFSLLLDQPVASGTVDIYNLVGEKTASFSIEHTNVISISNEGMAKGVYIVRISDGVNVMSRRMIIE